MQVPLVGFLYLVEDDILLHKKLWEPELGWVCSMSIRLTYTQATVNGGRALRSNAFIDMKDAKSIRGVE